MNWNKAYEGVWNGRRNIGLYGVGACTDTELDTILSTIQGMSLALVPLRFDYANDVGGFFIIGSKYGKHTIWTETNENTE